jgi:hypothetical protein
MKKESLGEKLDRLTEKAQKRALERQKERTDMLARVKEECSEHWQFCENLANVFGRLAGVEIENRQTGEIFKIREAIPWPTEPLVYRGKPKKNYR